LKAEIAESETQLAAKLDQKERAKILLFLAKSGILNSLNDKYLEKIATEQLKTDDNILPNFELSETLPSWTALAHPMNAVFQSTAESVGELITGGSFMGRQHCSGFFVAEDLFLTTDFCTNQAGEFLIIRVPTAMPSSETGSGNDKIFSFSELSLGVINVSDRVQPLSIAQDEVLKVGLRLVMIHAPLGQGLVVSECSVLQVNPSKFDHDCASMPGSGGAAILDRGSLEVVGIHIGAYPRSENGSAITFTKSSYQSLMTALDRAKQ